MNVFGPSVPHLSVRCPTKDEIYDTLFVDLLSTNIPSLNRNPREALNFMNTVAYLCTVKAHKIL
jgi:hypothetical protein